MELSKRGLELIKSFEGCRLTAYQCAAGVWTIGYGHTSGVKKGDKITQDQADAFLKSDCSRFVKHVNEINDKYHYGFNQNEFDALVSFAYNIGNIKQLTMNGQRNKFQIGYNMQFYVNAGGKKLAGLVRRRAAEYKLYTTPVEAEPVVVNKPNESYKVGKVYTTQVNLMVRKAPSATASKVGYAGLTASAKKADPDKNGSIAKGTKVTCKEVVKDTSGNTWIKIPSGYIAAIYKGEVYVK